MRNAKFSLIAASAHLALIGTLAITTARPAHAQGNGQPLGPDVRVVNTPAEPVPVTLEAPIPIPVSIQGSDVNQSARPIATRDTENPARQPFQRSFEFGHPLTVPTGKRLVIEFISIHGSVRDGQPLLAQVKTVADGVSETHRFPMHVAVSDDPKVFGAATATRIYADPDTDISITIGFRGDADDGFIGATVSGYLVDLP